MSAREPGEQLDVAVADLAARLRGALEPPAHAGVGATVASVRDRLDEQLPEAGEPLDRILPELAQRIDGGVPGTTGGRYFGYVTGGVLPAGALAQAWTLALDQNPGLWTLAPAASELDALVVRWVAELLGFPAGSGAITSGATLANVVGLAVARHWIGRTAGVDVDVDGVGALPPLAVYGSVELHFSDRKALRTLGLGTGCLREIPLDEQYRLRVRDLAAAIERDRADGVRPGIVIAQAGSVNTGASDPLDEIADLCAEHGIWLHVDGAFGAFFRLCERTRPFVAGLDRADSLTVDGHKWLNLPNGAGFALVRDAELHRATFAGTAAYLTPVPDAGLDRHQLDVEASRSWRGPAAWAVLKQLGRAGVAELVTRCCDLAQELADLVDASPVLERVAPAPTCVVCFRYRPGDALGGTELDELNRRIQADVARGGEVFLTAAELGNGYCLRACVVSWRTTSDDVRALVRVVEETGARLRHRA